MIFLDTGFLFALMSKRDAHHERVVEVFREFKDLRLAEQLVTTNHVIAETITLTLKVGHEQAVRLGDHARCLQMQVRVDLRSPAPRPALQHMRVMQQAIEEGGDRSGVAEELAPSLRALTQGRSGGP